MSKLKWIQEQDGYGQSCGRTNGMVEKSNLAFCPLQIKFFFSVLKSLSHWSTWLLSPSFFFTPGTTYIYILLFLTSLSQHPRCLYKSTVFLSAVPFTLLTVGPFEKNQIRSFSSLCPRYYID
jgi:hypothetical protein